MNQNTNVNLIPKFPFSGNLYFSQYDVGRVATINLVEDGTAYTIPSGATVKIQATKPSGLGFSVDCTYSGSVVTVVSTETMTNEYGRFPCELRIESGGVLLGTTNFTFNVEKSPHPEGTTDGTAESVVSEITLALQDALNDLQTESTTQQDAIQDKGDEVIASIPSDYTDLANGFQQITNTSTYSEGVAEYVDITFEVGFLEHTNGRIYTGGSYDSYKTSQIFSVSEGDVVTVVRADGTSGAMRTVCAYSSGSVVASAGEGQQVTSYTVPSGIDEIAFCTNAASPITKAKIERIQEGKSTTLKNNPLGYLKASGSLADGETISLPVHDVKLENVISFSGRLTTFGSIKIGKNIDQRPYITVDATNVTLYNGENTVTIPHGLTIADDLQITLFGNNGMSLKKIVVSSCGNEYVYPTTFMWDIALQGAYYVTSIGSTFTECTLSWSNSNINCPIWIFGDSYISFYSTRWPYYLYQDGFKNSAMFNGYSGEGSAQAFLALSNLLTCRVPQIVVWCLGMNNGDSSTAVNATWKENYDKVVELSKKYGFELVLYTTPTCPAVNNDFKNEIVRSSGYRYIDADGAVRIQGSTSWITGTLSADNTHPTEYGARVLYRKVLADLPEIMGFRQS